MESIGTSLSRYLASQERGILVPPGSARTIARWSQSRASPSRANYPCISQLASGQARARSGPLHAAAVPAPQATSVVTPVPPAPLSQKHGAISHQHQLPDGSVLELLEMRPSSTNVVRAAQPPLLFIHGASHGAWCFAEHFLPWFAQRGYLCFALSLRGHGSSTDESKSYPDKYAQSNEDVAHVIASLPKPPVLVAHSLGGFFAQRYLVEMASQRELPAVAGVVMMASAFLTACVPDMNWWRSQQSFVHAGKVIWWMMTSQVLTNPKGDKEMLFSPDLPDEQFLRYHHMLRSGRQALPATFKELQAYLPKVAEHAEACKQLSLPIAVMLAGSDTLIMPQQVQASAEYFGVEPIILPDLAHDIMLDTRWEDAAAILDAWLKRSISNVVLPAAKAS